MNNNWYQDIELDMGPAPFAVNIDRATTENENFRTTLWTGENLQLTVMSIKVGEDIGLEVHNDLDQFLRIEEGEGIIRMGDTEDINEFSSYVDGSYATIIPAGKYHNLFNTGKRPLKLYSVYAPVQHPYGTIHKTKEDAIEEERRREQDREEDFDE